MEKLKTLRRQNVLSIADLAKRSGVHRNTVARIESGEEAYPSTIRKLARALGVEPRELMRP